MEVLTLVLVGLVTFLVYLYLRRTKDDGYPVGPQSLPVIGNLLQLALAGSIVKFAESYRPIYGDVSDVKHIRLLIVEFA